MNSPIIQPLPLAFTPAFRVDSAFPVADRNQKAWNDDFQNLTDHSVEAVMVRLGISEEDAILAWENQLGLLSMPQRMEADKYLLDLAFDTAVKTQERQREEEQVIEMREMLLGLQQTNKRMAAENLSAEQRVEVKKMKTAAGVLASLTAVSHGGTSVVPSTAGNPLGGKVSSGVREIQDVDGTLYYSDVKAGALELASRNLPLARSMGASRLQFGITFSGLAWDLDTMWSYLSEEKARLQTLVLVPLSDDNYGLQFSYRMEAIPAFTDKTRLESLLRWEWRVGCLGIFYLQFLPKGMGGGVQIDNPYTHVQALQSIQTILWIFFGPSWQGFFEPLISRLGDDLAYYTRPHSNVDDHLFLVDVIQTSFGLAGSIMRTKKARAKFPTEKEAVESVVEQLQDVFVTNIPSARNVLTAGDGVATFAKSGRLHALKILYEAAVGKMTKKPSGAVAGKEEKSREVSTNKGPLAGGKLAQQVCVRNLLLQWDFKGEASWGGCPKPCRFAHTPVASLSRASFDLAMGNCDKIFGSSWASGGWGTKLETAFKPDQGGRKKATYLPDGTLIGSSNSKGKGGGGKSRGGAAGGEE